MHMTHLTEYLRKHNLTDAAFGALIRKDRTTVGRIRRREVAVDHETAATIYRETGGEVTPNDLYGLPPEAEKDAA
jgi:hypothetical protein